MHTSSPSFRRKLESSKGASNDALVQIAPLRVFRFDYRKLPGAPPSLDRFLARHPGMIGSGANSRLHGLVRLEPDQGVNTVFLCKTFREIVLVLPNSLNEIGGNAHVERSVPAAGEDINAWLLHGRRLLDSGLRRNDDPMEMCAYASLQGEGKNPGSRIGGGSEAEIVGVQHFRLHPAVPGSLEIANAP